MFCLCTARKTAVLRPAYIARGNGYGRGSEPASCPCEGVETRQTKDGCATGDSDKGRGGEASALSLQILFLIFCLPSPPHSVFPLFLIFCLPPAFLPLVLAFFLLSSHFCLPSLFLSLFPPFQFRIRALGLAGNMPDFLPFDKILLLLEKNSYVYALLKNLLPGRYSTSQIIRCFS